MDNREKIDELTKRLFNGATSAFADLKKIELILLNLKIETNRIDSPNARALARAGEIIEEAVVGLEDSTKAVRDMAKEIGRLNKED